MTFMSFQRTLNLFDEFMRNVDETNVLAPDDIVAFRFGIFGEVGGITSTAKKLKRDQKALPGPKKAAIEEFGDALWYLSALCLHRHVTFEQIFANVIHVLDDTCIFAADASEPAPDDQGSLLIDIPERDAALCKLGLHAAGLLNAGNDLAVEMTHLVGFAGAYAGALSACELSFAMVVRENIKKSRGAFLKPDIATMPIFDNSYEEDEQLPEEFEIRISQRASGLSYMSCRGIFIGDPLSDATQDPDGYRFHDVFHLANAALLNWSPVFRALLKRKRKSTPDIDRNQDGGRAIVVEEGLTAWLFTKAKDLNYFRDQDRVAYDILKTILDFVHGYEVERVPLKQWTRAILVGYEIWGKVHENCGGIVIGNRRERTLIYRPLD